MSWKEYKSVVDKRLEFVRMCEDGRYTMTELCERFGVSRNNGYKWLRRYQEQGLDGLRDQRREALNCPHRTLPEIEALLLKERDAHPTWGVRKLLAVLSADFPDRTFPVASTAHEILTRNGRVTTHGRRRRHAHPGKPVLEMNAPNSVWAADYKGQFLLGNGRLCYPLTVTDGFSRYLIGCRALTSTKAHLAKAAFVGLFRKFGLPDAILTDNGTPFASSGLAGLTDLAVWWLRLGIRRVRTQPAQPQQNGRHERMHRTLKAEATKPPQITQRAQQKAFDVFSHEYNDVRPHEGIGMVTPASIYAHSNRPYPERLPQVHYPSNFVVRRVSDSGSIRWCGSQISVSLTLAGQYIGLEQVDDGIWTIYFASAEIGRLDTRTASIK